MQKALRCWPLRHLPQTREFVSASPGLALLTLASVVSWQPWKRLSGTVCQGFPHPDSSDGVADTGSQSGVRLVFLLSRRVTLEAGAVQP